MVRKFEQESWFEVELVRQPPGVWKNDGPQYTLLLWEKDYRFFVNLASEHVESNKVVDGAKLRLERNEYIEQKKRKILEGNPTILDLLDLLWFEGEDAWRFADLLSEDIKRKIVRSIEKYVKLVPGENQTIIDEIQRRLRLL